MENTLCNQYDLNLKASKQTPLSPPCRFTPEELEREIEIAFKQIENGELISHEEVMKNMDEIIRQCTK